MTCYGIMQQAYSTTPPLMQEVAQSRKCMMVSVPAYFALLHATNIQHHPTTHTEDSSEQIVYDGQCMCLYDVDLHILEREQMIDE